MKMLMLALALLSFNAFAQQRMGNEAVEMFEVMSHPTVRQCLKNLSPGLTNISIKKLVARCPGCNYYTITANEMNIDIPSHEKLVISISGREQRGIGGQPVQTYKCNVSKKPE